MRSLSHSLVVVGVAFLLIGAAISPTGQQTIEETTGIETVGEAEAVAPLAVAAGGVAVIEGGQMLCDYYCADGGDKVESADAEQTKIDLYSSAAGVRDASETYLTEANHYIQDSKEVALMVGKNAAIRAYQNGSTKTQAEIRAQEAVNEYYSQRQVVLIQNWNNSINHFDYMVDVTRNETGIQAMDGSSYNVQGYVGFNWSTGWSGGSEFNMTEIRVEPMTLRNGSTVNVLAPHVRTANDDSNAGTWQSDSHTFKINSGAQTGMSDDEVDVYGLDIEASRISGGDYSDLDYLSFNEYESAWQNIESTGSSAQSEINTFVNTTYDEWGDQINESELVDPYLGSREYSPEGDYQSWALATYSSLGLGSPANLSSFGSMTITEDGQTVDGILMSDGLPESGTFETGVTYNASNLTGYQYVVGPSQSWELEDEFTIEEMRDSDGNNQTSVEYRDITYESANLSEYQAIADELADLRAEIEAAKQDARNGGGGLFPGIGNPLGGFGNLIMLIGGAFLLLALLMVIPNN